MKRVIGISETVFDILFRNDRPIAGVPGGSVFNGLTSLGRTGVECAIISETGDDHVGDLISKFLVSNGVSPEYMVRGKGKKSAVSLAFLDENSDAHYSFYKDYSNSGFEFRLPEVNGGDVILFGSYFALIPVLRPQVSSFLHYAKERGAILYYDVNFRPNHSHEIPQLMDSLHENLMLADIVRGSADDFGILYGETDPDRIWSRFMSSCCDSFICTQGPDGVQLRTKSLSCGWPSRRIQAVSTVGAGDSFNAGIVYGLVKHGIERSEIASLSKETWDRLVGYGIDFGCEVCMSTENYISPEFASRYRL